MSKNYGKFEVEGDLELKNAKVKITMYVDGDVVQEARNQAKIQNTKYQSLMNKALREYFLSEMSEKKRLKLIEERLDKLEAAAG